MKREKFGCPFFRFIQGKSDKTSRHDAGRRYLIFIILFNRYDAGRRYLRIIFASSQRSLFLECIS